MKNRTATLALALDVDSVSEVLPTVRLMPPELHWFKVGLELFCASGPQTIESLKSLGKSVFLDLKLHDIPRTVRRAVQVAARYGAGLMTIHAGGGRAMIQAAVEAAQSTGDGSTRIIAVTALTSLAEGDLRDTGVVGTVADHVIRLGELAIASGAHGLVCSPLEVKALRMRLGAEPFLITPGVRSTNNTVDDQKRTASAQQAVADGSDLLVVGRPIMEAADPSQAAGRFLREIQAATKQDQFSGRP